ncbi:hypothetical protein [Spirosoma montaniterrae]|nr:hypothetical protein [Spirosoma montaniterrae]
MNLSSGDYKVVAIADDEMLVIKGGGFLVPFLAIGAAAAAAVAIYEAGKYTGEVIYHLTHKK